MTHAWLIFMTQIFSRHVNMSISRLFLLRLCLSYIQTNLPVFLVRRNLLAGMSRHNRRRTRASHRKQPAFTQFTTSGFRKLGAVTVHLEPIQLHFCGSKQANAHRTELSAQHWHSRYIAWQRHDRRQREEPERLLAEQRRIFGGEMEEGDEDGLCSNMMAYFIGLDFIMQAEG